MGRQRVEVGVEAMVSGGWCDWIGVMGGMQAMGGGGGRLNFSQWAGNKWGRCLEVGFKMIGLEAIVGSGGDGQAMIGGGGGCDGEWRLRRLDCWHWVVRRR